MSSRPWKSASCAQTRYSDRRSDGDDPDGDGRRRFAPEVVCLRAKVAHDSVDLLHHRLRQDLHLGADLDLGRQATGDHESRHPRGRPARHRRAERSVAAASVNAGAHTLGVQHPKLLINAFAELRRGTQLIEIFVQAVGDPVAEVRSSMQIGSVTERSLKLLEEVVVSHAQATSAVGTKAPSSMRADGVAAASRCFARAR